MPNKSALRPSKYGGNKNTQNEIEENRKITLPLPPSTAMSNLAISNPEDEEQSIEVGRNPNPQSRRTEDVQKVYNTTSGPLTLNRSNLPQMNTATTNKNNFPLQTSNLKSKKLPFHTTGYGRSGRIQSRTSNTAILLQRWTESHWLHVYPSTIVVFDDEKNMEEWKGLNDAKNGKGASTKEMKKLEQNRINFDTTGYLQQKIDRFERKYGNLDSLDENEVKVFKKEKYSVEDITVPDSYIMEDVRSKYYTRNAPLMHTFKISYLGLRGRNLTAAFGSTEPMELKRLRSSIRYILKLTKKAAKSGKKKASVHAGDSSVISGFSRMHEGKSIISGVSKVSNTIYGKNTMTKKASFQHQKRIRSLANPTASIDSVNSISVDDHDGGVRRSGSREIQWVSNNGLGISQDA